MTNLKDLAIGVLSETLHGALPVKTAMELAQGVIDLSNKVNALEQQIRAFKNAKKPDPNYITHPSEGTK